MGRNNWQDKTRNKENIDYVSSCWRTENDQYKWPSQLLQTLIDTCDPLIGYKYKKYNATVQKENLETLSEAQHYCDKGLIQSTVEETT